LIWLKSIETCGVWAVVGCQRNVGECLREKNNDRSRKRGGF
jgi:hypothetical protein